MVILLSTIAKYFTVPPGYEAAAMRISDARYSRDLRRYQLAWRFIRLGARIRTAQRWTGLSTYRVHTLYDAYAKEGEVGPPAKGFAPRQVGYFFRSGQLRSEAAVLAGFLAVYGVFPDEPVRGAAETLESVGRGERLCRAYEEFKACWPEAQSTLEHAILLLTELVRGVQMALARCPDCDCLIVVDRLAATPARCAFCLHERQRGRPYQERAAGTADRCAESEQGPREIQRGLFEGS
jgi:hypothetical protein